VIHDQSARRLQESDSSTCAAVSPTLCTNGKGPVEIHDKDLLDVGVINNEGHTENLGVCAMMQ